MYSCCSKVVCNGCDYAHVMAGGGSSCPFCREPRLDEGDRRRRMMKRVEANDPVVKWV
jgi:hypothetical protein